jgi:hypothetical protein
MATQELREDPAFREWSEAYAENVTLFHEVGAGQHVAACCHR